MHNMIDENAELGKFLSSVSVTPQFQDSTRFKGTHTVSKKIEIRPGTKE